MPTETPLSVDITLSNGQELTMTQHQEKGGLKKWVSSPGWARGLKHSQILEAYRLATEKAEAVNAP